MKAALARARLLAVVGLWLPGCGGPGVGPGPADGYPAGVGDNRIAEYAQEGPDERAESAGSEVPEEPYRQPCEGRECGFVGGCLCGLCTSGSECVGGSCRPRESCADKCRARERRCGPIGPFCSCGECAADQSCNAEGICQLTSEYCAPFCEGRECGLVGAFYLGQFCDCGTCPEGTACDRERSVCR